MLDEFDRHIIALLGRDARLSLKALAQQVGMSSPSVSERLKRLEERGVIRGFTVDVDPAAIGYPLQAIVRIRPLPGKSHVVEKLISDTPEISECAKVTGDDCYIARLHVRTIEQLDKIVDMIADNAETNTAVVKAQTVKRRLLPLD